MKKIKFWNSDKIVSISAIAIGVGSLIVVTYQTNLIRNQTELIQQEQRISVMLYLEISSRTPTPDAKYLEILLSNSGLGPALIKKVQILAEDKTYPTDLVSYFLKNYQYQGQIEVNTVQVGKLIPAGASQTMLGINSQDSAFVEFVREFEEEVVFEIVYESLYGERWLLSSEENAPVRLE